MSQLVFSIHQNAEGVGSKASKGMDLPARGQAGKEQASFLHALYIGCQQKVWPTSKVDLPTSKDLLPLPVSEDLD